MSIYDKARIKQVQDNVRVKKTLDLLGKEFVELSAKRESKETNDIWKLIAIENDMDLIKKALVYFKQSKWVCKDKFAITLKVKTG